MVPTDIDMDIWTRALSVYGEVWYRIQGSDDEKHEAALAAVIRLLMREL